MDFKRTRPIQRGDIYYADLTPATGSEQNGIRPVKSLKLPSKVFHTVNKRFTAFFGKKPA